MFDRLNTRFVHLLLAGAALLTFLLSFLVVADVLGRAIFSKPVKGTPEMVSMSIVIICFLLAAYAVQSRSMISTDVIVGAFGMRGQHAATLLSGILGLIFFGLIFWGSFEPTLYAWTSGEFEGEGALRVPVWPARLVILIGSLLAAVTYFSHAVMAAAALLRGDGGPAR